MAEKGLLDGENTPSPEANMVRDELRNAVRNAEKAVVDLVTAFDHAEDFISGRRRRPSMNGIALPTKGATQLRE